MIKEAARRCSKCAEKIWEERNKENKDWVDSNDDLEERKKEANRAEWKFTSKKLEKAERPKKRIQQKIHKRKEHLKKQHTVTIKRVHEWVERENIRKTKARKLQLSLEEIAMIMEIEKEEAKKSINEDTQRDNKKSETSRGHTRPRPLKCEYD